MSHLCTKRYWKRTPITHTLYDLVALAQCSFGHVGPGKIQSAYLAGISNDTAVTDRVNDLLGSLAVSETHDTALASLVL